MLEGLFIASLIATCHQIAKEKLEPTISAENWANKKLYHKDLMDGISVEKRMENLKNGKYKSTETYPEPHKDIKTGKIIIENSQLYNKDVKNYGAYQAHEWMKQGKYNLTPKELEKEQERIKKHFEYLYSI